MHAAWPSLTAWGPSVAIGALAIWACCEGMVRSRLSHGKNVESKLSHFVELELAGSYLCLQAMAVLLEVPKLAFDVSCVWRRRHRAAGSFLMEQWPHGNTACELCWSLCWSARRAVASIPVEYFFERLSI